MASQPAQASVWIGTLTFGALTAPYLSFLKESLAAQSFQDFKLVIHDNTENNLGFARAYNRLFEEALRSGARYFLAINPDVRLAPDVLEKLVKAIEKDETVASVSPKLLRWDFKAGRLTDTIDSCGLQLLSGLRFVDLGQGELDRGQYDSAPIFGASGAAVLYRLEALRAVSEDGLYFDEHFFMYKEDCDLAYRFFLKGFKSVLASDAIAHHDRTAAGGGFWKRLTDRFKRSKQTNRWAFTHQHFLFFKYWRRQNFLNKLAVLAYAGVMFAEALVLEQYLLACYRDILKQRRSLKRY